jgi:Arc/MetJ-type ribon-helix-helix transcriptional regulator
VTYGRRTPQAARLTLRLPQRLAAAIDSAARADDRSLSEYVREVLRRDLRAQRYGVTRAARLEDELGGA